VNCLWRVLCFQCLGTRTKCPEDSQKTGIKWYAPCFTYYWVMTIVVWLSEHDYSTRASVCVRKGHWLTSVFMLKVVYMCNSHCIKSHIQVIRSQREIEKGRFFRVEQAFSPGAINILLCDWLLACLLDWLIVWMSNQLIERHGRICFWGEMTHSLGLKKYKYSTFPSLKMYIVLCQCVLMPEGHRRRKD
jgi:hypothetical protein